MATATLQHQTTESLWTDRTDWTPRTAGPLLVATDASEPSDAALRAARAISAHTGQRVRLIAVYAPLPLVVPEVQIAMCRGTHLEHRVTLNAQVKEQLERLGIQESWPLEVPAGDPAATIAAAAKNMGASMVIMGLGGHRIFHRIFGGEMVLKVLRLGTVPVLAVAPGFLGLPLHGLAAVDFSASGRRALALGGSLVQKNGRVTLAHVAGPNRDPVRRTVVDAAYAGSADRALSWMIAKTDVAETIRLERRVLSGDPADQLLQLADTLAPDLIIAGSHGHNFLTRLLIGSVSTRLLRESRRSILIVPPVEGPDFVEELPEERGRFAFYEWAERLEEFTRRNAGRLAVLEVIDPEMGAQVAEKDVPFVVASFAPRDARVHLMFGDGGTGGHRTRSIDGVTGIQMLRDRNGSDAFSASPTGVGRRS